MLFSEEVLADEEIRPSILKKHLQKKKKTQKKYKKKKTFTDKLKKYSEKQKEFFERKYSIKRADRCKCSLFHIST